MIDQNPTEATPYSALAEIYDFVMRHVDYVHWADYVDSVLVQHNMMPRTILDIACGTGSLAIELHQRGYRASGADGCAAMLARADAKTIAIGYEIPLHHQSFLELEGIGSHDTAVCLYDSMNYLMTLEDFATALERIRQTLHKGGLFVFDLCTEANSRRHFSDLREHEKGNGFTYTRRSYYEDGVQFNDFEIRFQKPERVVRELHQQRIYPLDTIYPVIEESSFVFEAAYDGFGFTKATDRSDRVHFVLRA